jgi:hypothetical protein
MKRHAVINKNNKVVNVIVWDGVTRWSPPQEHIAIQFDECDIGDTHDPENNKIIRADRTAKDEISE